MDPSPHSSYLPLQPSETTEAFRIDGTMAVRSLVRELIGANALVAVYAQEDADTFIVTRILALEADSLELDFTGDDNRLQDLLRAPYLTVVGVPGSVKIQFRLENVQLERAARRTPASGGPGGAGTLTAHLPATGWRVQRRNAFRVKPPEEDGATVTFRPSRGAEFKGQLTDLSVGGLAALWPSDAPEPELGSTLRHCRIDAPNIAPIPCDLRVVRVDHAEGMPARLSCEFYAMPQTVARFVQLYVMDIEKRARLAAQQKR